MGFLKAVSRRKASFGRIEGLDGLRAISILLVVYDHFFRLDQAPDPSSVLYWLCPFTGTTGVCIFFVLSGYLITRLLLSEREKHGRIDLGRFYVRRTLRIFPPFYAYLLLVGVVSTATSGMESPAAFGYSFFYLFNFCPYADHLVTHTWSLSIEEQFYLIWPAMLCAGTVACASIVGLLVVICWPLIRSLRHGFFAYPTVEQAINVAAMDTILCGAMLAVASESPRLRQTFQKYAQFPMVLPGAVIALYSLYAWKACLPKASFILLPLIRNFLITSVLWVVVAGPERIRKVLEWGPLVYLGMISYSLYLWQQAFWHPGVLEVCPRLAAIGFALVSGMISYHFLEVSAESYKNRCLGEQTRQESSSRTS